MLACHCHISLVLYFGTEFMLVPWSFSSISKHKIGVAYCTCLVSSYDDFNVEMAGEMAKESSYHTVSWWRKLVSSISSCSTHQNFSFSIYYFQLCRCCYKCQVQSLYSWINCGDNSWDFPDYLQVWNLTVWLNFWNAASSLDFLPTLDTY